MSKVVNKPGYDLEERTCMFSKAVLSLCKELPLDTVVRPLVSQVVRSATSIGANYMEANGASSRKDFSYKIFFCKKEAKETMYWLTLLGGVCKNQQEKIAALYKESKELTLIFSKIAASSKNLFQRVRKIECCSLKI